MYILYTLYIEKLLTKIGKKKAASRKTSPLYFHPGEGKHISNRPWSPGFK